MSVARNGKFIGGLVCLALAWLVMPAAAAEDGADAATVRELLERMKMMEKQMKSQAQEIHALKGDLKTAQTTAEIRPALNQRIDASLEKATSDRFFHDPKEHGRKIQIGGHVDVSYQFSFNRPEKIDPDGGSTTTVPIIQDPIFVGVPPAGFSGVPLIFGAPVTTVAGAPIANRNKFRSFDRDESNDFTANQIELFFDGTAKEVGEAGFRIDLNFGEDTTTIAGLSGEEVFTFDNIQQGYINYIAPIGSGLHFTGGRFVTDHGFEVIESKSNWNSTRSFNFGLAIPFTHTGLKMHYDVFENWQVAAMVTNGWDNTLDNNDDKYFHLRSLWKPLEWISWSVNGSMGNEGGQNGYDESAMRYLVNTNVWFNPWENWEFAVEYNYGVEKDESQHRFRTGSGTYNDAVWWGAAGYMKWKFADKWYFAGRGEYFNDKGGTRTGLTDENGVGQRVELYSLTATVNWNIADNMNIRFEYRHDGASHNAFDHLSRNPGLDPEGGTLSPARGGKATNDTLMMQWLYNF